MKTITEFPHEVRVIENNFIPMRDGAQLAARIWLPVDAEGVVRIDFLDLLRPYPLAVGVLTVTLFAMHGAIFLYLKTEGDLQAAAERWMHRWFVAFVAVYSSVTAYTLSEVPRATANFEHIPWLWVIPVLNVLAIANIPRAMYLKRPGYAFFSSCATIAALAFLFGAAMFPNLVPSTLDPEWSLTLADASSSESTLRTMLGFAGIGMPFVLTYTAVIYWVFRGKVKLDATSY